MKPIGLFFTGGVESTLLLHDLSLNNKNLNLYTVLNPYINLKRIENIIDHINFQNNTKISYPFLIPWKIKNNPDEIFIRWARHLADVELDVLYIGSNEYMEHLPKRKYISHKKIEIPYKGLYKDTIVEMYIKNDLVQLLNMTHSCFTDNEKHCGYCSGCKERIWAFMRNNI